MPPSFTFKCQECNYSTIDYTDWRNHLLTEGHQIQARERSKIWTIKAKQKAVVVFGIRTLRNVYVMRHLGGLAFVSDFVFWTDRQDFCIIQFLSPTFFESFVSKKHCVNGHTLILRRREDISDEEWISICPFLAPSETPAVDTAVNNCQEQEEHQASENFITIKESVPVLPNSIQDNGQNTENTFKNDQQEELETSEMWDNPPAEINPIDGYGGHGTNNNPETDTLKATDTDSGLWDLQMDELYNRNLMPMEDWNYRNTAKNKLEEFLRSKFPECILIPFGSGSTAISSACERETFSVFADLNGHTKKKSDNSKTEICMDVSKDEYIVLKQELMNLFNGCPFTFDVTYNSDTTMQGYEEDGIQFIYKEDGSQSEWLKCKLQIKNFFTVQCSQIIKFICSLDHRVRPILIVTRNWAYHNNLVQSSPGVDPKLKFQRFHAAISQWLVVFFLTKKGIIPSISTLQQYSDQPLTLSGVNLGFCSDPSVIGWVRKEDYEVDLATGNPSARCILTLFHEMLQFYSSLGLRSYIVSVNIGDTIRNHYKHPDAFKMLRNQNLFSNEAAVHDTLKLKTAQICIQHPLKLFINMTKAVSRKAAQDFQNCCGETAHKLHLLLSGALQNYNPVELLGPGSLSSLPVNFSEVPASINLSENNLRLEELNPNTDILDNISLRSDDGKISKTINFAKKIYLSDTFRDPLLKINSPVLKALKHTGAMNLVVVWLELFKNFNYLVWPVCFGVRLTPLEYSNNNSKVSHKPMPETWKLLGKPFQGVLVEPEKLEWVQKSQKFSKNKLKQLSSVLKKATLFSTENSSEDNVESQFKFECRLYVSHSTDIKDLKESLDSILMKFSNVSQVRGNENYCTRKIMSMYEKLWKIHFFRQLKRLKELEISEEVAHIFN